LKDFERIFCSGSLQKWLEQGCKLAGEKGSSDFPIKSKILHTSVDETTVSSIEVLVNRVFLPLSKIGTRIAKIPRGSGTAKVLSSNRGYVTKI